MPENDNQRIVFLAAPHLDQSGLLLRLVQEACERAAASSGKNVVLKHAAVLSETVAVIDGVMEDLASADIVIADITDGSPNVILEVGLAVGAGVSLILIARDIQRTPSMLRIMRILVYEGVGTRPFVPQLETQLDELLRLQRRRRTLWRSAMQRIPSEPRSSIFISYSHKDREYLERLQVHLKPLEEAGLIEVWDDTRIKAGDKWKSSIESALRRAAVAILLISADFLASEFIVKNELPPLLRAAEQKGTVVLPLVVKPSRFVRDPNLSVFQALNDPAKPVIALTPAEQESLYAALAERVEVMVKPAGA